MLPSSTRWFKTVNTYRIINRSKLTLSKPPMKFDFLSNQSVKEAFRFEILLHALILPILLLQTQ